MIDLEVNQILFVLTGFIFKICNILDKKINFEQDIDSGTSQEFPFIITLENIDFFYILTKQNAIIDNTEVNLRGSLCSESHSGLNSINMISLSNLIVMKEKMKEDKIYFRHFLLANVKMT